ncbi:hypothetical protein Pcinc_014532 [Petrolisthes cinctipes]|uniref:Uncharacterized protein n=1 Tax=Petrolisthes cinctipes TaxID=88211 RepID=A0AAE1G030_PETCI|nr:hypothetical protein Pcinc_014532 [Petrolisthes cinctipes]
MDRRNVQKVAQRARMVGMHEAGLSPHQIAADLGVHETTVYRWLKRMNNTRYVQEHVYAEARSGHVTCNVWGWIGLHGVGSNLLLHTSGKERGLG